MEQLHISCSAEKLRGRILRYEKEPVMGTFNECRYTIDTKRRGKNGFRVRLSSSLDPAQKKNGYYTHNEKGYENFAYFLGTLRENDAGTTVRGIYLSDVSNRFMTPQRILMAVALAVALICFAAQTVTQRIVAIGIVLLVLAVIVIGLEWDAEEYTKPHRKILKQFVEEHLLCP